MVSETLGILHDPQATLNPNKTLTVQFELKNCFKYWVGVWIRVSVRPEFMDLSNETGIETTKNQIVVQIPKQCWKRKGNVYSLTLPSNSRAPCSLHSHCSFPFMIKLKECKIYSVDFIPIYLTLQGQPTFANITVPPQVKKAFNREFFKFLFVIVLFFLGRRELYRFIEIGTSSFIKFNTRTQLEMVNTFE